MNVVNGPLTTYIYVVLGILVLFTLRNGALDSWMNESDLVVPHESDILFLKHDCSILRQSSYNVPCMWFMEEPSQFSVGQTAQSLTC